MLKIKQPILHISTFVDIVHIKQAHHYIVNSYVTKHTLSRFVAKLNTIPNMYSVNRNENLYHLLV